MKNLPKYVNSSIDDIAISSIDYLMHKNLNDIIENIDTNHNKTFEERKLCIQKVLYLVKNMLLMPSIDFIAESHALFNKKIITNYEIIDKVLLPYHKAFHECPDVKMSPFSELINGRLIKAVDDKEKFKKYLLELQALMKSRFSITLDDFYKSNEVIKKYDLQENFKNLTYRQLRTRSLSI